MSESTTPFKANCYNGHQTYPVTTEGRIRAVKGFSRAQCHAAVEVPGLQRTVERAVQVRMRQLDSIDSKERA
ncbi:hypothetical protein [Cupriavidus sp. H39]|uniref:hypothetical protein n=1 Tax=Cupriavidus sp. H39 TaxID=3401635 RepID=UPI003CFFC86B